MRDTIVIKIGGSSLRIGKLAQVLTLILERTRPIILVPGGGPFADFIRDAQKEFGFSDSAAHRMAILAMHQFANIISEYSDDFSPFETLDDLEDIQKKGQIPIWLPYRMAGASEDFPRDWTTTSDSLAAWLAIQLGAKEICLLKSCSVPQNKSLLELSDEGIIDKQFLSLAVQDTLKWSVLNISNEEEVLKLVCKRVDNFKEEH